MKIGVFDSGLGGVLILKAIAKELPEYDYEYYGDTKHVPFGDRSESEIYEFTKEAVEHLFKKDCLIVILACNTASAETLRKLQDEYLPANYPDRRILGVIIPVVEEVIEDKCKQVLLFGTQRTVGSGKYHLELGKRSILANLQEDKNALQTKIEAIATPELVPLLESGKLSKAVKLTQEKIDRHLNRGDKVDGVILGCTHYNLMLYKLRNQYPDITFFGQAEIIPEKIKNYLRKHSELESRLTHGGSRNIYLTEHRADYDQHLQELLGGHFIEE
jgi:glutamate racemase